MKSTYTVHDMTENVAEIWNTMININTHAHIIKLLVGTSHIMNNICHVTKDCL